MKTLDDKTLDYLEKTLNRTIKNLMYGGTTEPKWGECAGASACFQILKVLGLKLEDGDEILEHLSNREINGYEDFLRLYPAP
jgi:hypothetical protein